MKGKILLVAGLAVGYVLGTRAGRERYDDIKEKATNLWNDPRVQKNVDKAEGFVKDKAPEVADFVTDNAKKAASQVTGKKASATSSVTGTSSTSPSASTK